MAFQFGLALLGPPGWAAAIAITAGLMIAGAMASDNMGISEDSPFYEWTHSDGDESPRQVQPETPKVITPSVTPQQAADYYEGGELPTVTDVPGSEMGGTFDEDEYIAGVLAPDYEPAHPWGYVSVAENGRGSYENEEEDDFTKPPSCSFSVSASAYESGAKFVLIFASIFFLTLLAINSFSDGARPRRY